MSTLELWSCGDEEEDEGEEEDESDDEDEGGEEDELMVRGESSEFSFGAS